ncbi:MAG: class I SAM-dependent methyltransferase [Pseudomonadota bacterium]
MKQPSAKPEAPWDTSSHQDFYRYYENESSSAAARARFASIQATLLRVTGWAGRTLRVADVGCGAGTQSALWAARGDHVFGADINQALIALARRRAASAGLAIRFEVASATALPWDDQSIDICIAPELLEHVADWRSCLREFVRVLKPGGALYISTSNRLCPFQEEFDLPAYAWYPARLKRHYEELARTTRPELAGYATYPAVNWFSFYALRAHLGQYGMRCLDRFDLIDQSSCKPAARATVRALRALAPLRWCGHVLTPYTTLLGVKPGA